MPNQYYVDLKDGYQIGDTYVHNGDETKKYKVVDIEAWNQIMIVEEVCYDIEIIWEVEADDEVA